jgi:hypothetical protein
VRCYDQHVVGWVIAGVFLAVGILLLVTTGWVAALVFAFMVAMVALITFLSRFAQDRAEDHGIMRFGPDD